MRALKGLVLLQALVRGQAVRRQTNITLRSLQSLIKIQSHARASRVKTVEDSEIYELNDKSQRSSKGFDYLRASVSNLPCFTYFMLTTLAIDFISWLHGYLDTPLFSLAKI